MLISQMLRPDEVVRFASPHYAMAPLAGLQMNDGAAAIGDQWLVRCNRAEWETAERGYVFKDWHASYYEANPVFLVRQFGAPVAPADIAAVMDGLARDAARIVTACRLYKTGHLLEPIYTARFLVTDQLVHRAVGPYRTEYLAMPIDGLTWQLASNEVDDVALIYGNLDLMAQTKGTEALHVVIDQFNLSHTPTITSFFSLHVLFTAMEVLFDGVPQRVALGTTRFARALQVLRWSEGAGLDPAFERFYRDQVFAVRNAVHHHDLSVGEIDLDDARFRIQMALSMGIRLLMRLHRTAADPGMSGLRQAHGWQELSLKDLMNVCLDRHAAGDPAVLQEIVELAA